LTDVHELFERTMAQLVVISYHPVTHAEHCPLTMPELQLVPTPCQLPGELGF
jgi:hypothetical protein